MDCSTLMQAANTGRIDVILLCIRSGLSVNLKADDGFTALHSAARMNQAEALTCLLRCGADTNTYSGKSNPTLPVHEAILERSLECFQLLLQANSAIKSPDGTLKETANCIVAAGDPRIAQHLLETSLGDVEVAPTIDALALAAAGCGQLAIIRSLTLSHPEDVKVAANSRQSPLYLAAKRGYFLIVESLLNLCESRKVSNETLVSVRVSSMRAAAKRGHVDVLRLLLPSGERTLAEVMIVAVEDEQPHVVRFLAEREPHLGGEFDDALRQAIRQNHVEIATYLTSLGPYDSHDSLDAILHLAIDCWSWASVEALLHSINGNINVRYGFNGPTALHKAVQIGRILTMKLLLQHEDIDVNTEWNSSTALDMAITNGCTEAIALLLRQADLDVNRVTLGETTLHRVIEKASPEVLVLLLQRPDINVNVKSGQGRTPLHLVLQAKHSRASDRSLQDKLGQLLISHKTFNPFTWKSSSGTLVGTLEKYGYWSSFESLLIRDNVRMPSSIW